MPRKPRFYLPGQPAHVIQRGNCRLAVFFCDDDYRAYLHWLSGGVSKYGCRIHAYVLMTNHVHLLVTPESKDSISRTIQHVGRHYVSYVNRKYGKSGTLWEGRHKGCTLASDGYFLRCMRYIEMNPVRAHMVERPEQYPWSSFKSNASGKSDELITHHKSYAELSATDQLRGEAYRALFDTVMVPEEIDEIRSAVQTGTPLGNDRFRAQIEQTLNCSVGQARRGRPRKPDVR